MLPAEEQFLTDEPPLPIHLWLAPGRKLTLLQRKSKISFEARAGTIALVHAFFVDAVAAAPFSFGAIERDIGPAHQLVASRGALSACTAPMLAPPNTCVSERLKGTWNSSMIAAQSASISTRSQPSQRITANSSPPRRATVSLVAPAAGAGGEIADQLVAGEVPERSLTSLKRSRSIKSSDKAPPR